MPALSSVLWLRSSVRFLSLRASICHSISQFSYTVMGSVRARRAKGVRRFVPISTKDPALAIPLSIPSHLPQPPRAPPPSFPIQVLPPAPLYAAQDVVQDCSQVVGVTPSFEEMVKMVESSISDKLETFTRDIATSFAADVDKFLESAESRFVDMLGDLQIDGAKKHVKQAVVAEVADVVTSTVGVWLEDLDKKRSQLSKRVDDIKAALEKKHSLCSSTICLSCHASLCRHGPRVYPADAPDACRYEEIVPLLDPQKICGNRQTRVLMSHTNQMLFLKR